MRSYQEVPLEGGFFHDCFLAEWFHRTDASHLLGYPLAQMFAQSGLEPLTPLLRRCPSGVTTVFEKTIPLWIVFLPHL